MFVTSSVMRRNCPGKSYTYPFWCYLLITPIPLPTCMVWSFGRTRKGVRIFDGHCCLLPALQQRAAREDGPRP